MRGHVRVALGALVGLSSLVGCIPGFGDCAMKPFGALPLAAIGPPAPPGADPPAASCASMIDFDGRRYHRSGGEDTWTIAIDDLEPIGLASAANESAWEDNTVFAISGVEPQDAIAMRYGTGATIAVLLAGDLSESMCVYVTVPEVEPACASGN